MRYESDRPAEPGGVAVYAVDGGGREELDPRTDLRNHSPTGFSWGYRGSGPAQLALAALAHRAADEEALEHYQLFKERVVSAADPDRPFRLTGEEVDAFLERRR